MVLHNTQAVLALAYDDAHASDEYRDEDDEVGAEGTGSLVCPICLSDSFYEDGEWVCEGGC